MIDIYFEAFDTRIKLPVLPSDLRFSSEGNNRLTETVKLGEISVLRQRKLRTFDIASFFPTQSYSFVRTKDDFKHPRFYIDFFTRLQEERQSVKFVVTGLKIAPFFVSVESFEHSYKSDDEDIPFVLSLREYRHYGGRELNRISPDEDSPVYDIATSVRPKNGFAMGDKVIVTGTAYRRSDGGISKFPTNVAGFALDALQSSNLVNETCRIVRAKKYSRSGILQPYPYKIADGKQKAIGWVAESSMRHA